jgi:uncharacterized protein (TIRG00374 family)
VIVEESEGASAPSQTILAKRQIPWLRLAVSLLLSLLGLWFITRDVSLNEVLLALERARMQYVILGLVLISLTIAAKAWRWQLTFYTHDETPAFRHVFWALVLGQLVNTAVPFLRLGELARIYDFGARANQSRARALGTLVVEKVLDLIMLVLTLVVLVPFLVVPNFVGKSGVILGIAGVTALLALIMGALRTDLALRLANILLAPLPDAIRNRSYNILTAGLEGIAALGSGRALFFLLLSSAVIALLSVMTPWVMFPALGISLGLVPAAAIHVVLTIGSVPPSTPAKVGVFEFLVAFMLRSFGVQDGALILAYTIIFHLVVVLPQIVFGGIAGLRKTGLKND